MSMVTACGDDEPTDGTSGTGGGTPATLPLKVPTFGGNLLTGLQSDHDLLTFNYSNGALMSITTNEHSLIFKDNMYFSQDYQETETLSDFKLNNDGFITSCKYTYTDRDETEVIVFTNKYSGHNLVSCTWDSKGVDEGEPYAYNYEITFTWKNGNITRADVKYTDEEETETGYYLLTYGNTPNAHKQYSLLMSAMLDLDGPDFPQLGLFGDGPAYLPTKVVKEYGDDEPVTMNLTYTLNHNGTIASETEVSEYGNTNSYYYYYNGEGPKKVAPFAAKRATKPSLAKALRHHRHGRK